ncbi:MAG: hypothetical protein WBH04_01850 [Albidovulum sp.]
MQVQTIPYATHPTRKGERVLEADLYLPSGDHAPADLLVWMHSGGFRTGSRSHRNHGQLAAEFARHGIASAFIDYRLARPPAILTARSEALLPALIAEARNIGEEMHETFFGARPLGVVEDCCAFLNLAALRAQEWNLTGRILLGGSSAGAISALNVLHLAPALGLDRPLIATVLAYSGGFAFPSRIAPTGARILAQANPNDARVPISSIRRYHAAQREAGADACMLIEHDAYAHGELRLSQSEALSDAVARAVAFDRSSDPSALQVGLIGARLVR